jgi:hypothetical protein
MSTRHYSLPECLTACLQVGEPGYIEAGAMLDPEFSRRTQHILEIANRLKMDVFDYCQHCIDFADEHARLRLIGKELIMFRVEKKGNTRSPRAHQYLEKKLGRVVPMKQPGMFDFPANPYMVSGLKLSTLLYARYFFAAEAGIDDPAEDDNDAEELRSTHNDQVVYQITTNLVYWATSHFRMAQFGHFYLYDHLTRKCSIERYPVYK